MRILKFAALTLGALALTLPAMSPADAQSRGGKSDASRAWEKPTGHAKTSVNRPKASGGGNHGGGQGARSGGGGKQISNQNAYKAGQASGKKKGGNNTVIVNNSGGGAGRNGYYDNGRYYDNDRYDDNDNDFLEFVGKTAAITAEVSVVAAVIGSTTNEKPDDCQPVNSNGISYMYCNGTYYQQSGSSSQPSYTVVAPPQ